MARILNRRLSRLEAGIGQMPQHSSHRAKLVAVLDELASLLASGASHIRGGVRVDPEDIPGRILGPGYTDGDLRRLAVARASEAGAFEASEVPRIVLVIEALHERGVKRTRGEGR